MRRFAILVPVALIVATLPHAFAGGPEGALQGVWQATFVEASGEKLDDKETKARKLQVIGTTAVLHGANGPGTEVKFKIEVDAKKTPHTIDFVHESYPTLQGIFEIKGTEMKLCIRREGKNTQRPTTFATKKNSGEILIVFEKQK